ncbi:MAG: glycosyltransferase family 4 protein [Bacteroidota bacterium]|nr:glycosyltransferase family 4 protein [Bacteroidota bacterium]
MANLYLHAVVIVVNTRLLIHDKLDGIGRFGYESLIRITRNHPEAHFVFLFDRNVHEDFIFSENITPVKLLPPARRPWLWNIWFNISVKGVLRDLKPDLFLSIDGYLPLNIKTPCLPVIHDLNFEHYPKDMPARYARWYRKKFPLFAKQAARIATVSEFSKNDIAEHYHIPKEKIDVVYNGAASGFLPIDEEQQKLMREKFTAGEPFFLYIGALHPRKNLERLIRAFRAFKKQTGSSTKLVLAGGNYWKYDGLRMTVAEFQDKSEIIFTGRLSEEELHRLTASARALTYVPYFEGFGIPIVEAMSCDVPVITSEITAMPEVAGEAALYVDPFSEESICSALVLIDKDESLREKLISKARIQREKFSWDKTADALWESMMKVIEYEKRN